MTNMYYKLDEKDRKILSELDLDSRVTDSEIAKKVGLSKQIVNYRIQRLIENKIISNFYTLLNVGKLGFNSYYVFFQLQKINKKKEEEIIEFLKKQKNIGWLVNCTGKWDMIFLIYAKSDFEFNSYLNEIQIKYDEYLLEYEFTSLIEAEHISYKSISTKNNKTIKQTEKEEKISLEETEIKLLNAISQNARISVVELAEITKEKIHVISYHLKKLIKNKIIEGFKPKLNISELELQWYLLLIRFQPINEKRKNEFLKFCRSHPQIYYLTNTLGTYNLMIDIHVKDAREFKEILLEIKEKYFDIIKFYETNIIFDEFKIDYVPELK